MASPKTSRCARLPPINPNWSQKGIKVSATCPHEPAKDATAASATAPISGAGTAKPALANSVAFDTSVTSDSSSPMAASATAAQAVGNGVTGKVAIWRAEFGEFVPRQVPAADVIEVPAPQQAGPIVDGSERGRYRARSDGGVPHFLGPHSVADGQVMKRPMPMEMTAVKRNGVGLGEEVANERDAFVVLAGLVGDVSQAVQCE